MSRRVVIWVVAALLIAGVFVGGGIWAVSEYQATHGPECTVPRPPAGTIAADGQGGNTQPLGLDAVQLQHASTVNAVGLARGESARARVVAVATAWQESSLRNVESGDRDSLGLFQQRPSQGWGDPEQIMDPVYAAGQFFDHLAKVRGWQDMSLTEAAQAVQRSGFPDAYAKWEWDAQTLVDQLSGDRPVTLSCRRGAAASTAQPPPRDPPAGMSGASRQMADLLSAAHAELSGLTIESTPAGGGRATVTVALADTGADVSGRALAAWFVAHSATFGVTEVDVGNRSWSGHRWHEAAGERAPGSVTVAVAG